jgi:hypothetical protein
MTTNKNGKIHKVSLMTCAQNNSLNIELTGQVINYNLQKVYRV